MEVTNNDKLRYFELTDNGNVIHISSPLLDRGFKTFKEKRLFYRRFKMLEQRLQKSWSARTDLSNITMIKILTKIGAYVWYVDVKKDKLYFFKPRKAS